jgi:branched-chain amino acid transport system ATP-binding protein
MSSLEVTGLSACHGQLTAVRGVGFTLAPGEVLALVGANGAGKTTLMRTLAGSHRASGGRVRLAGEDITDWPAHRRVRHGLALVPEGRRLFGDMSVRENLRVAGEHGRSGPWTLDTVLQALPALAARIDARAEVLSGGQRQAVAIGRALMTNPEVLLLDEVSLGLSPAAIDGVYEHLWLLREARSTSLLLVEQDLARALAFADRVICLREGRIVLEGACAALTREAVTAAYFGLEAPAGPSGDPT